MMLEKMRERMNFTTLRFNRLDDLIDATGVSRDRLCTYCWDGKE
jgi:amidophosphoribosyltransferase